MRKEEMVKLVVDLLRESDRANEIYLTRSRRVGYLELAHEIVETVLSCVSDVNDDKMAPMEPDVLIINKPTLDLRERELELSDAMWEQKENEGVDHVLSMGLYVAINWLRYGTKPNDGLADYYYKVLNEVKSDFDGMCKMYGID
jgi:hypothetical protein